MNKRVAAMNDVNGKSAGLRLAATSTLLLLNLILPAAGCRKHENTDATSDEGKKVKEQPSRSVQTRFIKVQKKKLRQTLQLTGTLAADASSDVASSIGGLVTGIRFDFGQKVRAKDVLVELDSRDAKLRLAQAGASVQQSLARLGISNYRKVEIDQVPDVKLAKESLELAISEEERAKKLLAQGSMTQQTYDQAKTRLEQAKIQHENSINGVKQAMASLSAAQANAALSAKTVSDYQVIAPFDGYISEKRIQVGEWASVGRVVAVLVKTDPMRLRLEVPESEVAKVAVDSKVLVRVAAYDSKIFEGTIKRLGATVQTQSRTLIAEAEIANPQNVLKPGFFANAEVLLNEDSKDSTLVPKSAIGIAGLSSRVFVKKANTVTEVLVKPGRIEGDLVDIGQLLSLDDEVAIENVDKLSHGSEYVLAQ